MIRKTPPTEAIRLLQTIMRHLPKGDVYIACSDDFFIDKIIAYMGFSVHSNGTSLYSKIISDIILRKDDTPLTITNETLSELFGQWEPHPFKKLIEVIYIMKIGCFAAESNDYERLMSNVYKEKHHDFYTKTLKQLKGVFDIPIIDFSYCSFLNFLNRKPAAAIGLYIETGYVGKYAKFCKSLQENTSYTGIEEAPIQKADKPRVYEHLLSIDNIILLLNEPYDNINSYLKAKISQGRSAGAVYIYSSVPTLSQKKYYIEKNIEKLYGGLPIMKPDFIFTEETKIAIQVVPRSIVNYYKDFYMSARVNYTANGGDYGIAFSADGQVFGLTSFSIKLSTYDDVYCLTDFVVNSHQAKLSKLLIMLELSREVRHLIARSQKNLYKAIRTTVITDKPISMKYRSVFKLTERKEGALIYRGEFTEETLDSIYHQWLKKYQNKQVQR